MLDETSFHSVNDQTLEAYNQPKEDKNNKGGFFEMIRGIARNTVTNASPRLNKDSKSKSSSKVRFMK